MTSAAGLSPAASVSGKIRVERRVLREVAAPLPPHGRNRLQGLGHLAVTRDALGVGELLVAQLQSGGISAGLIDGFDIPKGTDGLIWLEALGAKAVDRDAAMMSNRRAFLAAKQMAVTLARGPGLLVTVQDTGGDFGLSGSSGCWGAGLSGLVKTARLEWPRASVQAIDLDCGERTVEQLAQALVSELIAGGGEAEVGLRRDGRRTTLSLSSSALSDCSQGSRKKAAIPAVDSNSVILATGGARGVTAQCLIELAREFKPKGFILCGRTPLGTEPASCHDVQGDAGLKQALMNEARASGLALSPRELTSRAEQVQRNREISSNIQALRDAGSQVEYLCVDICDAQALRAAVDPICAQWGPLTGIVHGAGVLADKLIADKTPEQFDSVFKGKVRGLDQLLQAFESSPLSLICLFSSVAARAGNTGQADYAMANEVLNKVAGYEAKRRGGSCLVKSFNWGPWEGGMVTPELSRHFKGMGVQLIPLREGAELFVREISAADHGSVEIVVGNVLGGPHAV